MTYDYCCSRDGHGLEIPGFSAVFIQTFSIKQERQFFLSKEYDKHLPGDEDYVFHKEKFVYEEKADALTSRSCRWGGASRNRYLSCATKARLLTRKMSGGFHCEDLTSRCRSSLRKMKSSRVCSGVMSMWRCHCSSAIPCPSLTVFFLTDIPEHCPRLSALTI